MDMITSDRETCRHDGICREVCPYGPVEALAVPQGQKVHGASMSGHPRHRYPRIPIRNEASVRWRQPGTKERGCAMLDAPLAVTDPETPGTGVTPSGHAIISVRTRTHDR